MACQRRVPRTRSQLPTCYYEGFLEKKSFKDKIGRNLWTSLCGNTLFFYNNSKDSDYVEKQDLSQFVSVNDDTGYDRNLDAAKFHLRLLNDDIYLTAPSLETRELWKGYIYSVVKLAVPSAFNLLPGQKRILSEVVEKEKERLKEIAKKKKPATKTVATPGCNIYETILYEMPGCYHLVSRGDAEILLEMNQEKGNLLLRPSKDGNCFAVTTRLELNGPVFKHYKVTRTCDGGFAIAVESPIACNTLDDVINCLVEKTGGVLRPLDLDQTYEEAIVYVQSNEESGEKSLQCAPNNATPPKVPPKPGYKQSNDESGEKSLRYSPSNPTPPKLPPKPAQKKKDPDWEENLYLNSDEEESFDEDPFLTPPVQPRRPGRPLIHQTSLSELPVGPGGALIPPNLRRHSTTVAPETKPKPRFPIPLQDNLSHCLNKELKEKMQKRAVSE